ncbi:cell division protein FtsQ/DivIB [Planctomicrobium sp. SH664]|uniref:cell division protein FtsQ/DivIB n=1 Tax=Planctomicrobium sp. SH664 TaxID=3448125 RepID=UPI003F5BDBE2
MAAAANSTKSRKPARPPSAGAGEPAAPSFLRNWLFRPGTLIIAAFFTAIVVLVPYLPWLLPNLVEQPEYQFTLDRIEINAPTAWVPSTIAEQVREGANLPETVSLLEPRLCQEVAEAWSKHPWIQSVKSVQITNAPGLRIEVEYRQPVAFVATDKGLYPVDREGILLPPSDFKIGETGRLPLIRGITTQPQSAAGFPWGDNAVRAGAQLAAILAPEQDLEKYWNRFHCKAILVSAANRFATPEQLNLEIETVGGSRIIWGRPPGADALEPTVDQKLLRLQQCLSRIGSFETPGRPYRVDIRQFDAIGLEPIQGQLK